MSSYSSPTSRGISFREVVINPTNLKCSSLPLFSLRNQYAINFHLAWFGFFAAFLSWFAFAPLISDAIKQDLQLTSTQVGNSSVISLSATIFVRLVAGPLVDRYGPRKVMVWLLVLGAIPSGLAGTASSPIGLYMVRFFIGILGGAFVTCQAWTTAFFDKSVVGTANALAGGFGDTGGGMTYIVMVALYDGLLSAGLTPHIAWRASFVIVPVPLLFIVAIAIMVFGTDHPAGKWSDRHQAVGPPIRSQGGDDVPEEDKTYTSPGGGNKDDPEKKAGLTDVASIQDMNMVSELDYVVSEPLTLGLAWKALCTPLTWLPSFGYFTTFGFEIAINNDLVRVILSLFKSEKFGQTEAGYLASIFLLLNVVTRPLGGYCGDLVYKRWGVAGKKYLMIALGVAQGLLCVGFGVYIDRPGEPSLSVLMGLVVVLAFTNEGANGVNFSLVPHCNPSANGFMSGIVGAMGNLGGIVFALIFRFQPVPTGKAFWISGIIAMGINPLLSFIHVPRV